MTFYNAELPGFVDNGAEAIPSALVDIARGPTGNEQRRSRRSRPLLRFNLGKSLRGINDAYDVLELFHVMNGPTHSFAIKNLLDYKSCAPGDSTTALDAAIGTGDGATAAFQLKKQYKITLLDASVVAIDHDITLPVQGTVKIAVDEDEKTEGVHFNVDYLTGIVTFTGGNIPADEAEVTAGFEFRVKVRFDSQDLSTIIDFIHLGSVPSVPLIEVPNG